MSNDNFLLAARNKERFVSTTKFHGCTINMFTAETLFDIPLDSKSRPSINSLYKERELILKETSVSGLVSTPVKEDASVRLQLAILKQVFELRTAEERAKADANAKAKKRQKIINAIADNEDKEFDGKTNDELRKMLEDL